MDFYLRLSDAAFYVKEAKKSLQRGNFDIYDRIEVQRQLETAESRIKALEDKYCQ